MVASGVALRGSDLRDAAPDLADLYPDPGEWVNAGDSAVVAPGGRLVAGPLRNAFGILYADVPHEAIDNARRTLDVTGHYARPDLFTLTVRNRAWPPVVFDDG